MLVRRGSVVCLLLAATHACSDDGGGGGGPATDAGDAATDGAGVGGSGAATSDAGDASSDVELRLDFERVKPMTSFVAVLRATRNGAPQPGLAPSITSSRGSIGPITDAGDGSYRATITPDALGTGDYVVTASASDASVTRSAVVLAEVGSRWGQPQAFAGYVNTPGWEDSLVISPDGQWALVLYLPITIDCLLSHPTEPAHPSCAKARGPWAAPERPGMPGAERISADGTIHHGCPSLGLDPAPFAVPPQAVFGFRRMEDGSFREPFAISIDGVDGCAGIYGPSLTPPNAGKSTMVFGFDTPLDGDPPTGTQSDVYTMELSLGTPTSVGTFSSGALAMNATLLGFPAAGHQGNPDWKSNVLVIDDESAAERDLFVYELSGTFPVGPWTGPTKLPPPLSEPGAEDTQPFVDDVEALWNRNLSIVSSQRSSGALTDPTTFGPLAIELAGDDGATQPGAIIGVGEPTKAMRDGRQVLAFIYVKRASDGTLDLDAGFVEEQP